MTVHTGTHPQMKSRYVHTYRDPFSNATQVHTGTHSQMQHRCIQGPIPNSKKGTWDPCLVPSNKIKHQNLHYSPSCNDKVEMRYCIAPHCKQWCGVAHPISLGHFPGLTSLGGRVGHKKMADERKELAKWHQPQAGRAWIKI